MTDHGPCLSRSGLRRRGWTDAAIDRLLREPDFEADNPHFAGGAPAKMYTMVRIEAAEQTPEFSLWNEKRSKRTGKDIRRQLSQTGDAQAKEPTKEGNAAAAMRDSRRDGDDYDDVETLGDWLEGLK